MKKLLLGVQIEDLERQMEYQVNPCHAYVDALLWRRIKVR
jgi:hypothetical protein